MQAGKSINTYFSLRVEISLKSRGQNFIFKQISSLNLASIKPFIFIILAALFLLLEMGLQVSVSVITPQLMHDIHLSAPGIGVMSSFYFYSYTMMQIPGGMFFDIFSSKKLIALSILLCAAGTLMFAVANGVVSASAGRFLIGLGSAFAWVALLYVASQWFPDKYFSLISGIGMIIAALGAMGGQLPLAVLVGNVGWRMALIILAVSGAVLSILSFLIIEDKTTKNPFKIKQLFTLKNNLLVIIKRKQTWSVAIFAFLIWAPITAFASLWGVPFIQSAYHTDIKTACFACSLIWVGVAIGSPLLGWWSERINLRVLPLAVGAAIGTISSIIIIYLNVPAPILYISLLLFGIAAGG